MNLFKHYFKKIILDRLIAANFSIDEIQDFFLSDGFPSIRLNDGTELSAFGSRNLPSLEKHGIPAGFQDVVHSYILRYKFPHFDPSRQLATSGIPLRWMSFLVHPQHKNTFMEFSPDEQAFLSKTFALQPGDQVLEIGPFIGFGTVAMSRLVGDSGKIVTVEADPEAIRLLELNAKQNNLGNVQSFNFAVGESDEAEVTFWKQRMQANSLLPMKDAAEVKIQMRKIETIIEQGGIQPTFIILTINGYEWKALEACREFLASARPLRLITPGWYDDGEGLVGPRIIALLRSLNYRVFHTKGWHIFAVKE